MKTFGIRYFVLFLAGLFLAGSFVPVMAQQNIIWIDDDYSGENGDIIDIEVMLNNETIPVSDMSFQISFNHRWFDLVGCEPGALIDDWQSFRCREVEAGVYLIETSNLNPIMPGNTGVILVFSLELDCDTCEEGDESPLPLDRLEGDIERFTKGNGLFTYGPSGPDCINHGDVNLDGEVTAADAQLAFSIVLGTYSPTYEQECAADCLGTGEVTAGDAQAIFFVVLGLGNCADPV